MSASERTPWLTEKPIKKYSVCNVYIMAIIANCLLVAGGFSLNWIAPVLPKLLSNNTNINPLGRKISTLEVSAVASAPFLSGIFGFLITAKVSDLIGRKKTMLCSALINAISFNVIAFASNIIFYYIFLSLLGVSFAGIFITVPAYNSEISDKDLRRRLSSFIGMGIPIGVLLSFTIGSVTSFKVFTIINSLPALLHLFLAPLIIVESPIYLSLRGKKNEALKTLEILRRNKNQRDIEMEFLEISSNMKTDENKIYMLNLFKTTASKKALFLSIFLYGSQQTSGCIVILTFIETIFNEAGSSLKADTLGIILSGEQLTVVTIMIYFINKFDRKYLLLVSSFVCSLSLFVWSTYLILKTFHFNLTDHIEWLPAASAMVFFAGYNVGYGPIPLSLGGELFANNLRSVGISISLFCECSLTFLLKFTFPLFSEYLGLSFILLVYAIFGLINFTVFYVFLPETKKKSLNEIQSILSK